MIDSLKTEIEVMKELNNEHIVKLHDCIGDAKQTVNKMLLIPLDNDY